MEPCSLAFCKKWISPNTSTSVPGAPLKVQSLWYSTISVLYLPSSSIKPPWQSGGNWASNSLNPWRRSAKAIWKWRHRHRHRTHIPFIPFKVLCSLCSGHVILLKPNWNQAWRTMANSVPTGQTNLAEDVMATMMLRIMLVTQACKNMTSSIQKHQSKRLCWVLPIGKQLTFPALPNGAWPASSRAARGTRETFWSNFSQTLDRSTGVQAVQESILKE